MGGSVIAVLASFSGILFVVAFGVLWFRTRSPWLLAALIIEVVTLLCRIAFMVAPAFLSGIEIFMAAWQLSSLLLGVCLLGYAFSVQPASDSQGAP